MKKNKSTFAKAVLAAGLAVYTFMPNAAKSADLDEQGNVRVPQADGTFKTMDRQTYEAYFGPVTKAREEIMLAVGPSSSKEAYNDVTLNRVSPTRTASQSVQSVQTPVSARRIVSRPEPKVAYANNPGRTKYYLVRGKQYIPEHYDELVASGQLDVSPQLFTLKEEVIEDFLRKGRGKLHLSGEPVVRVSKTELIMQSDWEQATSILQEKYPGMSASSIEQIALQNGRDVDAARIRNINTVVARDNTAAELAAQRQQLAAAQQAQTQARSVPSGGAYDNSVSDEWNAIYQQGYNESIQRGGRGDDGYHGFWGGHMRNLPEWGLD